MKLLIFRSWIFGVPFILPSLSFLLISLIGWGPIATVRGEDSHRVFTDEDAKRGYRSWHSLARFWQFSAVIEGDTRRVGEPVWMSLSMQNVTSMPLKLLTYHPCIDYHFTLRRVTVGPVGYTQKGRDLYRDDAAWSGQSAMPGPGEKEVTRVNLAEYFDLQTAGVYQVYVTRPLSDLAMFIPSRFRKLADELSAGPILFVITAK